jgi:hypothetical protein
VPWVWWPAVKPERSRQAAEALQVLSLIIYRAPADVRGRFREQLHARNLADPGDPAAPPNSARSWSRPGLYAQCFTAILEDLDQPERALALSALGALSTPTAKRTSPCATRNGDG